MRTRKRVEPDRPFLGGSARLAARRGHEGLKWVDPSLMPARQIDDRFRRHAAVDAPRFE